MNQKHIGIIVMIAGILLATFVLVSKNREDDYIREIMRTNDGSCFLEDGTCLHADRTFLSYVLGGSLAGILIIFGIYLTFFDDTQQFLAEHQVKVSSALNEAKKNERERDEFNAFLSGFNEDEQKVLKSVKEQDGIKQATLRYRTGISKTQLSLLLKNLETRQIITKKPSGKTNQIFLRQKY